MTATTSELREQLIKFDNADKSTDEKALKAFQEIEAYIEQHTQLARVDTEEELFLALAIVTVRRDRIKVLETYIELTNSPLATRYLKETIKEGERIKKLTAPKKKEG